MTSSMSPAGKVALFRCLFRGRDDVYPRLWENARTGKKGYARLVPMNGRGAPLFRTDRRQRVVGWGGGFPLERTGRGSGTMAAIHTCSCGARVKLPDRTEGVTLRCPQCKIEIEVIRPASPLYPPPPTPAPVPTAAPAVSSRPVAAPGNGCSSLLKSSATAPLMVVTAKCDRRS